MPQVYELRVVTLGCGENSDDFAFVEVIEGHITGRTYETTGDLFDDAFIGNSRVIVPDEYHLDRLTAFANRHKVFFNANTFSEIDRSAFSQLWDVPPRLALVRAIELARQVCEHFKNSLPTQRYILAEQGEEMRSKINDARLAVEDYLRSVKGQNEPIKHNDPELLADLKIANAYIEMCAAGLREEVVDIGLLENTEGILRNFIDKHGKDALAIVGAMTTILGFVSAVLALVV